MLSETNQNQRFDLEIFELIPHRPPMLLINSIEVVTAKTACAIVIIDDQAPFFEADIGVPTWIGLEYMGQTAALIAGFQLREGLTKPHLGYLLGCRNYSVQQACFAPQTKLRVACTEAAIVGESLATFNCTIQDHRTEQEIAQASLSVFRKPSSHKRTD